MASSGKAPGPTARDVAVIVLERVYGDGAFAAAALDAELSRAVHLDERDRALATELCYGVLRTRGALERKLATLTNLQKTDSWVRSHLLVAAQQILLLDRVPAHAAVDSAVASVSARRGKRVGGFVNAVLRKLARSEERLDLDEAVLTSAPPWLYARLVEAVGAPEARALLGADAAFGPEASLRVRPGRTVPDWLADAPLGRVSPLARRLRGAGDLRRRPGYAEGDFVIQEEGAQVVGLCLGARPGERVLDACAGRGQKATLLADLVGPTGRVVAADLHPQKLAALQHDAERLGLTHLETHAVDWTVGPAAVPGDFNRVLVDAPCSGVGTLRRRPEIAARLTPEDPARLAALAERILRGATTRVAPGGRVLFAVCSVLPDEGAELIGRVDDILAPAPFDAPELRDVLPEGATTLTLLPVAHGTEGYFVASFVRVA